MLGGEITVKSKTSSSLADKIYSTIKGAILNRELSPGTKLSEEALAQILQVSRTPIRTALQRLSYEKLVTINKRVTTVASPTVKEVQEVFEMRMLLEDFTVSKACENAWKSQKVIKHLEEILEVEKQAYESKDMNRVLTRVFDFHIEIARLVDNSHVLRNLEQMIALTNMYIAFYSEMDIESPNSPEEHRGILNEIEKGDKAAAREKMKAHLGGIINRLNFDKIKSSNQDLHDILLRNQIL
ncbi:GntR family transcriptional regulator [Ammoniphilus sp. CFH 90114]|uniref:GntR family transcriptional regulator n=1 Tax=Ammoniphilus sp. CFH 90114 TaxID=2493665 RepID=UPI00100F1C45|nr:GntR family transcriptional regulator [Ammoniphilus sp. CFH 90114]RXT02375.1 GntR family transcriptional regulator [Ammoniphilus sp. CFH 90114]